MINNYCPLRLSVDVLFIKKSVFSDRRGQRCVRVCVIVTGGPTWFVFENRKNAEKNEKKKHKSKRESIDFSPRVKRTKIPRDSNAKIGAFIDP